MKKPYRRQTINFTREILNLRLNISWEHVTELSLNLSKITPLGPKVFKPV